MKSMKAKVEKLDNKIDNRVKNGINVCIFEVSIIKLITYAKKTIFYLHCRIRVNNLMYNT